MERVYITVHKLLFLLKTDTVCAKTDFEIQKNNVLIPSRCLNKGMVDKLEVINKRWVRVKLLPGNLLHGAVSLINYSLKHLNNSRKLCNNFSNTFHRTHCGSILEVSKHSRGT